MRRFSLIWAGILGLALVLAAGGGCAEVRVVDITTKPEGATIKVNGQDRGRAPVVERFTFKKPEDVHRVTASRPGYKDQTIPITREFEKSDLVIELKPLTRRVYFTVTPTAAMISVDGKQLSEEPVERISTELEFTLDARNNWTTHTVVAERPGFAPVQKTVTWTDNDQDYTLALEPLKKDITITTTPPGATILVNGNSIGQSPVTVKDQPFLIDLKTEKFKGVTIRAERSGFDPSETSIVWEEGKNEYHLNLIPVSKSVRILTEPSGATITIDGKEVPRDAAGAAAAKLFFPPAGVDGAAAKTYAIVATKKAKDTEWEPGKLSIGWDDGKAEYTIKLKEILTRNVALVVPTAQRTDEGWEIVAETRNTLAMKDVTEGTEKEPPTRLTDLPAGSFIESLSISPDGERLLFSMLNPSPTVLRSQMVIIRPDGSGGMEFLPEGKTLDLHPSFTPDGQQIVFASNRGGKRLSIWQISAIGAPGITELTPSTDATNLWPVVDSDPKPRLYYQSYVDTRSEPRLYMTQLGTVTRTDLTTGGGTQPRVSPKADSVIYTNANETTGKRDLFRMSDKGGAGKNLTDTPDIDEHDAAFSPDGSKIAFVSDQAEDPADKRRNHDIWIMDFANGNHVTQVTTNGSWDDSPQWDPQGHAIYFRSNRGGEWAVWRIELPK